MGVNPDASTHMLPTTRLALALKRTLGIAKPDNAGPRDPKKIAQRPKNPIKRFLRESKSMLVVLNRVAEEWFRQGVAWYYQRRGYIVLFDRHYFSDYYTYDIATTPQHTSLARRIHGYMLKNVYPRPSLTIYLDAPAEVLFARKGEGTVTLLEERRKAYMQMRDIVPCFAMVDATLPPDDVTNCVKEVIWDYYRSRTGGK
jgi:hypothetical protein